MSPSSGWRPHPDEAAAGSAASVTPSLDRRARLGSTRRLRAAGRVALAALAAAAAAPAAAEWKEAKAGAFVVTHELILPGSPETIYDAITGDVSGWWDHSFSGAPKRFHIEARPGGGFYEIFDDAGNGVLHGTVIYAHRGKTLRFEGPLGFSGKALHLVTTWEFAPAGADSTRLSASVRGAGEIEDGWPAAVDRVWRHFLIGRFKPYVEAGKHLKR